MKKTVITFLILICTFTNVSANFNSIFLNFIPDQTSREKIANDIVTNLVNKNYSAVRRDFDDDLKKQLPVENISQSWESINSQIGNYQNTISSTNITIQGFNQIKKRCQFRSAIVNIEITFDSNEKVEGLLIRP